MEQRQGAKVDKSKGQLQQDLQKRIQNELSDTIGKQPEEIDLDVLKERIQQTVRHFVMNQISVDVGGDSTTGKLEVNMSIPAWLVEMMQAK